MAFRRFLELLYETKKNATINGVLWTQVFGLFSGPNDDIHSNRYFQDRGKLDFQISDP
jgi:hypothetical protein